MRASVKRTSFLRQSLAVLHLILFWEVENMYKKIISCVLALTMSIGTVSLSASADTSSAKSKSVTDYTYTVTPILSPFNEYFFVKTDNPDPTSFRFADKSSIYYKSSIYEENSTISLDCDWNDELYLYADINYENEQT